MPPLLMLPLIGRRVVSLADVNALELRTYLTAVVTAVVFLGVAAFIGNSIAYEGGANPSDPRKRRMWFWSLAATALSSFFLYNMLAVSPSVAARWQSRFMSTSNYSALVLLGTYVLLGFVISRVFATGKLGTWFGRLRR